MRMILLVAALWVQIVSPRPPQTPNTPEPVVPQVTAPEVSSPDVVFSRRDVPTPTNEQLHLLHVQVSIYGSTNLHRGIWQLRRDSSFVMTNHLPNRVSVETFSLYTIAEMSVLSWRVSRVSNTWHEFVPNEMRVVTLDGRTNDGRADWSWLFVIPLENDAGRKNFFTMFYDSWEKGEGDRMRWRHARFPHFNHHFTAPVAGTTTRIQFIYP